MAKIIKIQILHELAKNSAKNETYQKGVVDKAVDPKLITAAFHEQAGNEDYHEAMLSRYLFSQIELLKTFFADYITGGGNVAEDATIGATETAGVTEIVLNVSDRFNDGYVKTLARLSQKYVEDRMVYLWWLSVSKDFAAIYASAAEEVRAAIMACFNKTAPTPPSYDFPTAIEIQFPSIGKRAAVPAASPAGYAVPADTLMSCPYIMAVGDETEISYVLYSPSGKKPVDDVIVRADDGCCMPCLNNEGRWKVKGIKPGMSVITLFSRHDDSVQARIAIRVTE